jgi:nucleotide-binding universal stress UspA family protein
MGACDADHCGFRHRWFIVEIERCAMGSIETVNEIKLNNLLYLTDFSEPAEAALPFVTAIAREYGSKIYACHFLLPSVYTCMAPEFGDVVSAGQEQGAEAEMQSVESRLTGLPHKTRIERGSEVRGTLQRMVEENNIDLVVLGTHGRRGVQKLLLGSVAEEIWRSASVPILTIGPGVSRSQTSEGFRCVLFATDFTSESLAGLPYAVSMAREYRAHLVLLHVIRQFKKEEILGELSASDAIYHLGQLVPTDARLCHRPDLEVKYGVPAQNIIDTASQCGADLIVLGVRKGDVFGIATHVGRTIAHQVVVSAACPVLTVPG